MASAPTKPRPLGAPRDPSNPGPGPAVDHASHAFETGEVLLREGEPATHALLLDKGRVRLLKRLGGGERGLRVVGAGEVFGEEALLAGSYYNATAIALTPGTALRFGSGSLEALLRESPEIGSLLVEQLAKRLRQAEDRIEISMLRDGQAKVILGLLRVYQALPGPQGASATLLVSPLELSARVGLDVDAVKRTVQRLREMEYVRVTEESIEIPSLPALQELYALLESGEEIVGGLGR